MCHNSIYNTKLVMNRIIKEALMCLILVATFTLNYVAALAQQDIKLKVLLSGQKGRIFCYDSSTKINGTNKIFIEYLGKIHNKDHNEFKILTWSRVWGPNEHTTGSIYIYNIQNKFIGKYVLGDRWDLPMKIKKNSLIFIKQGRGCNTVTRIDFSEEIPKQIFIKCKGEYGDVYSLSSEEQ
jgi:hypothetical protein